MSDNLGYLFAAYAAVWIGIALYLRRLGRRQHELEEELHALRGRLGR